MLRVQVRVRVQALVLVLVLVQVQAQAQVQVLVLVLVLVQVQAQAQVQVLVQVLVQVQVQVQAQMQVQVQVQVQAQALRELLQLLLRLRIQTYCLRSSNQAPLRSISSAAVLCSTSSPHPELPPSLARHLRGCSFVVRNGLSVRSPAWSVVDWHFHTQPVDSPRNQGDLRSALRNAQPWRARLVQGERKAGQTPHPCRAG
jgi:hypothetical protein